jgi:hypothetical protein
MRSSFARRFSIGGLAVLSLLPCVRGQMANGTFLSPIANEPFTGVSQIELIQSGDVLKASRAVARDSQGRVYKEARQLQPAKESTPPRMLMAALYDPKTMLYTYIYPPEQAYWEGSLSAPTKLLAREYYSGWPTRYGPRVSIGTHVEDLGTRTMQGVLTHGERQTSSRVVNGENAVETDEYWYSDELGLTLLARHHVPGVTLTVTVTKLIRTEPKADLFAVPAGYHRKDSPEPAP